MYNLEKIKMHPSAQVSNAPTTHNFKGIYLGRNTETSLRGWCNITQQNYNTVKSRFKRRMANCPYSKSSRVTYYQHYAFLMAINLKQPFDELVLYRTEDFLERVSWIVQELLHLELSHKKLIKEKRNKVKYQLARGLYLSDILEELFDDYGLFLTKQQLNQFKQEFLKDKEEYKTLNHLALEYGQSPKLVNNRIYKKKWGIDKALNTVSY